VAGLGGNVLEHPSLAADFTLVDQHGSAFRMADTRGKVVLMTFIYTHCTDICPFEAAKVKVSHDLLGSDAEKVAFVTVTTDPKRDTPQVMAAYSRALELDDVWRFVGGDPKAVQAVWADYGIGVSIDPATEAVAEGQESDKGDSASHSMHAADPGFANGLSSLDLDLVGRIIDQFGGGYDVGHSAPFWFIDKHGYIRAVMDGSATPTEMVKSIRALLALR
jgi:cytochrome oxidase Cu insertion factor (SCO1/SenC/PrrC family)